MYVYPAFGWVDAHIEESKNALSGSLGKVCGQDAAANTVVAVTRMSPEDEGGRMAALEPIFARMHVQRPDNSPEAAWTILEPVLNRCAQWRRTKEEQAGNKDCRCCCIVSTS